jgi:hypothetical protein
VVDLVDVETDRLQGLGEAFEERAGARQAFVVVAGLVEVVGGIDQLQLALGVAAEQAELRLQAGVQGPALVGQALHLLLQHKAAVVGVRLAIDMADADHAAVPRLPGHRNQRGEIATGHEVRGVRLHAHAADGEPGEAGALLGHGLEPGHRHRFGLRRTMDVDELGQDILDAMLIDDALRFSGQHGSSLLVMGTAFGFSGDARAGRKGFADRGDGGAQDRLSGCCALGHWPEFHSGNLLSSQECNPLAKFAVPLAVAAKGAFLLYIWETCFHCGKVMRPQMHRRTFLGRK